jgi:putative membrane protein
MQDLLLTIAHHIFVFALVAILSAEIAAIRPNMRPDQIDHLSKLDLGYGIVAILVIVAGVSRVHWGAKGPDFFMENPYFWAKMVTFILIGLLSIPPTLKIRSWRKANAGGGSFSPSEAEIAPVRRWMLYQAALLPLVLIFAAMMVRYGAF